MPRAVSPTESHPGVPVQTGSATQGTGLILAIFFMAFFLPLGGEVLGMSVYPLRAVVLILFIPFVARLLMGQAGRLTLPDVLLASFSIWIMVTLVFHHGLERLPYGAVLGIEAFGGYTLGRILIRTSADYRKFIQFFLITLMLMIVPAFLEFLHPGPGSMVRWGFARVQLNFPHEILYGLFCSMAVANSYYLYRDRKISLILALGIALSTTVMSLSSAPLLAMVLQLGMILWDKVTGGRWKLFAGLSLAAYVFLQLFTSRGAVVFLINKVTFSPQTGYMRLHIWTHGKAAVLNNPIFGIGLNDWPRPTWLTPSVDNFWLLTAMRHGLPGVTLLLGALIVHIVLILRVQTMDPLRQTIRVAYLVTLLGLMFTLCTVHIWNELVIFVMFYIGAGAFLYTSPPETGPEPGEADQTAPKDRRTALPLTRFRPSSHSTARAALVPVRARRSSVTESQSR
jgi:hypothetical protein